MSEANEGRYQCSNPDNYFDRDQISVKIQTSEPRKYALSPGIISTWHSLDPCRVAKVCQKVKRKQWQQSASPILLLWKPNQIPCQLLENILRDQCKFSHVCFCPRFCPPSLIRFISLGYSNYWCLKTSSSSFLFAKAPRLA